LIKAGSEIDVPREVLVEFFKEDVNVLKVFFGEEFDGKASEIAQDGSVIGGVPVMKHDFFFEDIFLFHVFNDCSILLHEFFPLVFELFLGTGILVSEVLICVVELEFCVHQKISVVVSEKGSLMFATSNMRSNQFIMNSLWFSVNHGVWVKLVKVGVFSSYVQVKLKVFILRVRWEDGKHFETYKKSFPSRIIFLKRKNILSKTRLILV
jgi:hypothetical protein